jgi:ABC transporter, phosphonate, periplasmic substrate-binding protein
MVSLQKWSVILVSLLACTSSYALTLAVEPNYAPEDAKKIYAPLAAYLSKATKQKVEVVVSSSFNFYWSDLRANKGYDLVFEQAHFTDYRARKFGYVPLVRTAEKASFALLVQNPLPHNTPSDLVGKGVVTMGAPSLAYALLLDYYKNPMQQPEIRTQTTSWRDAVQIVFDEGADAAFVPVWLQNEYPNLMPVVTTREFPGAAISASPRLDSKIRDLVTTALLKLHEDESQQEVITELAITQFVPATRAEYLGSEQVLKSFYGYQN